MSGLESRRREVVNKNGSQNLGQDDTDNGSIDGPLVSNHPGASSEVSRPYGHLGSTKDGALQGTIAATPRRRHRIPARDIDAIADRLSDRDRAILASVHEHQFMAVHHIEAVHFHGIAPDSRSRITRRVLARLRDDLRVLGTLERRIGGVRAGSQGLVYYLNAAGDRILNRRSGRRARRAYEPSERFLAHRLAVVDVRIALLKAHRDGAIDLISVNVEPSAWRKYIGIGAVRRTLKPDLYVETATANQLVHAWFVEADLGTESIPTLITKCREYETYRQTGIEQEHYGAFPRVVWSVTHRDPVKAQRRRDVFSDAIAADRALPELLFQIVPPDQVVPLIGGQG